MNLEDLTAALQASNIDPQAYSLNELGDYPSETFVIRLRRSGVVGRPDYWETYYSERGQASGLRRFEAEDDACRYFLEWISSDQSTRLR